MKETPVHVAVLAVEGAAEDKFVYSVREFPSRVLRHRCDDEYDVLLRLGGYCSFVLPFFLQPFLFSQAATV